MTTKRSGFKQFLTPGWVIAAVLIGIFSYYAFTFLAPWQLGKNEALVQRNEHITEAFENPPRPIGEVLGAGGELAPDDEWSRVTATGSYGGDDVLLRMRPVDRNPAFQVLTPFHLDSGRTIVVNRGWVPAVDGTQVPEIAPAPAGEVTVTGLMLGDEGVHPSQPLSEQGYQMVYSISPGQVGDLLGDEVVEPYLQLLSGEPGELSAIPLPQLETGNHLSYGLQWILFGLAAPAGLIYFLFAETRERRRFAEEQEQLLAGTAAAPAGPPPGETDAPRPAAVDKPHASRQRYGSSRTNPWAKAYDKERER